MASKRDVARLLLELRSFAEITNRRVPPAYAQAVWISTRPGVLQPYFPRFKRHIRVHHQEESTVPTPVPITHLPAAF